MTYNWQDPNWPNFIYQAEAFLPQTMDLIAKIGESLGASEVLKLNQKESLELEFLVAEALKSAEIEGEYLSREDVYFSVRKEMGLPTSSSSKDQRAQGIASLVVSVFRTFNDDLSKEMLFEWHAKMLSFQSRSISLGAWRKHHEPMQIVSGSAGREVVHFEAPPSGQVGLEMDAFIRWFNASAPGGSHDLKNPLIRAAISHIYFESIHPFEDGNGRIGRALVEKALFQSFQKPFLISWSKALEHNKKYYYQALKSSQNGLDITPWISFFFSSLDEALDDTKFHIQHIVWKAKLFDQFGTKLNKHQSKCLNKMMAFLPKEFEGGMTNKKYQSITGVSKATASRDLTELAMLGILKKVGGGRSTAYQINNNAV